jgi:hypothetical protein
LSLKLEKFRAVHDEAERSTEAQTSVVIEG